MSTDLKVYKDALSEENLAEYATKLHEHQNETVKFMARKQIEVGRLLLKAREEFKGDLEFGHWRQEHTPIGSRQTATKLMALARTHATGRLTDKILDKLPTSTIFELLSAPDSVMKIVEEKLDAGEVPSQKEVRKDVKDAKDPEPEKEKPAKEKPAKVPHRELEDNAAYDESKYNEIVQESLAARVVWAIENSVPRMTDEISWVVFGIPPFMEGFPHEDVVQACYSLYMNGKDYQLDADQQAVVTKAFKRLMNFYK